MGVLDELFNMPVTTQPTFAPGVGSTMPPSIYDIWRRSRATPLGGNAPFSPIIVDKWGGTPKDDPDQTLTDTISRMPASGDRASTPIGSPQPGFKVPPTGTTTRGTSGETSVATPSTGSPAYTGTPKSSVLDQLMTRDRTAIEEKRRAMEEFNRGPGEAKINWKRALAAMLLGGAEGAVSGSAARGMHLAMPILQQPQQELEKNWNERRTAAQRDYENALQSFNLDLTQNRVEAEDADRAAQADLRARQGKEIDWRMGGGPEKQKIEIENQQRAQAAERLRAGGYSERDIAEFMATGKLEKTPAVNNEAELALAAHKIGADGRPTPEAVQAAAALKDLRNMKISEIHAAKDPNDRAKLLRDLQTNDTAVRGQLQAELRALETDVMGKNDPAVQAQVQAIKKTIAGIDEDLKFVNDEIRGAVNMPRRGAAPPAQPPNYTVSAPGRPPVNKYLTPEQVQQLQKAHGVTVTPLQTQGPAQGSAAR